MWSLDKTAIKELARNLADVRMEFVELLPDCDARSLEKAEWAEEAKLAAGSVFVL